MINRNIKSIMFICILVFYFSCEKNNIKKIYKDGGLYSETGYNERGEKDGMEKVYYSSGNIQYETYYSKNKIDSINEFYDDKKNTFHSKFNTQGNNLFKTRIISMDGNDYTVGINLMSQKNTFKRQGWWSQYKNKHLYSKSEYITVGDTTRINQIYNYRLDGSINTEESHYYKINIPDTIEANKLYTFTVELVSPIIGMKYNYMTVLKLSDNISSDFMNYWESKSTYNKKEIRTNLWEINHKFIQKGNFIIRGSILRMCVDEKKLANGMIQMQPINDITYLKKEIYVK